MPGQTTPVGMVATTTRIRGSWDAMVSATSLPMEPPSTPIRLGSTSGRALSQLTAPLKYSSGIRPRSLGRPGASK